MNTKKYEDFLDEIDSLIRLDYDAIEAYEAAINRLNNHQYKSQLEAFMEDHKNHIRALSLFLEQEEDREAPKGPDMESLLTQGKVVLANLTGDDTNILRAMKSNEEQTNKAYQHINEYEDTPPNLKMILRKGYEDEKRHLDWIEKELQRVA